jgi:hypothetical protein
MAAPTHEANHAAAIPGVEKGPRWRTGATIIKCISDPPPSLFSLLSAENLQQKLSSKL